MQKLTAYRSSCAADVGAMNACGFGRQQLMQGLSVAYPHNKALIPKTTYLRDRDYIMRMLYKNCY